MATFVLVHPAWFGGRCPAWTLFEMDSAHLPFITAPDQVAKVLLTLAP